MFPVVPTIMVNGKSTVWQTKYDSDQEDYPDDTELMEQQGKIMSNAGRTNPFHFSLGGDDRYLPPNFVLTTQTVWKQIETLSTMEFGCITTNLLMVMREILPRFTMAIT